jgi:hypothetical protein
MFIVLQGRGASDEGEAFALRAKVRLDAHGIPPDAWAMSPQLCRHLQRRIHRGQERGRVQLPTGGVLFWKLVREWK